MNANAWENLPLRRQYLAEHAEDELLYLWPGEGREARFVLHELAMPVWLSRRFTPAVCVHHLAKGANGADRVDITSNMVAVSGRTHDWVERYRADGMALCIRAKVDADDWDNDAMRRVFGLDRAGASVIQFVGRKGFVHDWVRETWEGLVSVERERGWAA